MKKILLLLFLGSLLLAVAATGKEAKIEARCLIPDCEISG